MSPGWCSFGNTAGGAGIQQHGVHLNTKEKQSSGACSNPCSGRVLSCVIAGLSQALITADQGENLSEEKEKKPLPSCRALTPSPGALGTGDGM